MLINLSKLFAAEGKEISFTPDIELENIQVQDYMYDLVEKAPVSLRIQNLGDRTFLLKCKADLSLDMPCDRCLESVRESFQLDFERMIDLNLTDEERQEAHDEQPYIDGYELDVDQLVYNELLSNLPMKVLCKNNCKGICNRCGANLNHENCNCDNQSLDPRMSVIQDIFNQSKEV